MPTLLLRALLLFVLLLCTAVRAQAPASLEQLELERLDEGLRLAYSVKLELPRATEEALHKGVPLYFVAEARIARKRWYWRDATVARAERHWRLSYQPLTRQYRLSTSAGLQQGFDSLGEALAAMRRASHWSLDLREELDRSASYELSFNFYLDTRQLPGPLQIGLGGGAQWGVSRERNVLAAELGFAS